MSTEAVKQKRKVFPRVISIILILILLIILAIAGFIGFCAFDKKQSLSIFPHDYSVYLHADSAWDTVEPMLDLKAMDMLLAAPELTGIRGMFMQLRASQWRKNIFLSKLASKSVDGAVYKNENNKYNFIVSIDLGTLAFVGRCFPYLYNNLSIKGLYKENDHFIFDSNGTYYYIKPYKNLIVATDNPELLEKAFEEDYNNYPINDLKLFTEKNDASIKIIANVSKLLLDSAGSNEIISQFNKSIPENSLSLIYLDISDENIKLKAEVPYSLPEEENYLLASVLNKKSTTPSILARFRENVQYYTILNAGTLQELKNAFLPLAVQDADKFWRKADSLSKSIFSLSLDDLLFSWSGNEIIMFGLEERNDPVFAIQIKDEKQRQKIFEKFTSSMLIKHNSSLLLDGVRIPRLELPAFLQELLKLFDVSLPHPYYFIQDGFIYFSESAENLCEIYKSESRLEKISQKMNWKTISKGLSSASAISLYYDLERSVPFFLKSKASLSNILSLYQVGRFDLAFTEGEILIQLSAISKAVDNGNTIPGFPVELGGKVDGKLLIENSKAKNKNNAIYWVENKKTISSMEVPSTAIKRLEMQDEVYIAVTPEPLENSKGVLWAVTAQGSVYLLNRKLEVQKDFPVMLGENISVPPFAGSDGLYVVTEKGHLYWMDHKGNSAERYIDISGSIKSTPTICHDSKGNRYMGIYDKSFLGKVIVLIEGTKNETYSFDFPGIAYGSPAILFNKNEELPYVGFVTQSGDMHIWNLNTQSEISVMLGAVFKSAPVACGEYFFAVSSNGSVYRIDKSGDFILIDIPNATCNEAFVSATSDRIYVCPDGNIIYSFDTNLELVYPFPVTGWGIPVFEDVNGDNIQDCFTLSIDNKLNAYKMK